MGRWGCTAAGGSGSGSAGGPLGATVLPGSVPSAPRSRTRQQQLLGLPATHPLTALGLGHAQRSLAPRAVGAGVGHGAAGVHARGLLAHRLRAGRESAGRKVYLETAGKAEPGGPAAASGRATRRRQLQLRRLSGRRQATFGSPIPPRRCKPPLTACSAGQAKSVGSGAAEAVARTTTVLRRPLAGAWERWAASRGALSVASIAFRCVSGRRRLARPLGCCTSCGLRRGQPPCRLVAAPSAAATVAGRAGRATCGAEQLVQEGAVGMCPHNHQHGSPSQQQRQHLTAARGQRPYSRGASPPRKARHVRRYQRGALHTKPPRLHAAALCRRKAGRRLDGRQRVARQVAVVGQRPLQRLQRPLAQPQQRLPALRGGGGRGSRCRGEPLQRHRTQTNLGRSVPSPCAIGGTFSADLPCQHQPPSTGRPAAHRLSAGVFNEQKRAAGLEHPRHLCQHLRHIWHAAQHLHGAVGGQAGAQPGIRGAA